MDIQHQEDNGVNERTVHSVRTITSNEGSWSESKKDDRGDINTREGTYGWD